MELKVVECKRDLFLGLKQRVRFGGQLSEEVRIPPVLLQGNFFLAQVFGRTLSKL